MCFQKVPLLRRGKGVQNKLLTSETDMKLTLKTTKKIPVLTFSCSFLLSLSISEGYKRWNLHPPYNSWVFTLRFQSLLILPHRAGLWQTCLSCALKCQETNKLSFLSRLTFLELQHRVHIHLWSSNFSAQQATFQRGKLDETLWASCLWLISGDKDGMELEV